MEEKQLDFNQPFLSVRRFSSTPGLSEAQERRRRRVRSSLHKLPPLPQYKSELKSGPIRKPGKVPFVWEKVPGKPKEEEELPNLTALDCHLAAPKLPPGSSQKVEFKNQDSGNDSKAVVAKDLQIRTETHSVDEIVAKPVTKHENAEERIGDGGGGSCSDEGDEAFLDALDTFSRSDSFFLNCSLTSGLSRLDGLDLRSPRRFDAHPVDRDLMMGRFLPAAKAMASETSQHATRKALPVVQQIPRPEKVSDNWVKEDCPNIKQSRPKIPLRYILNGFGGESEDDDCDDYENSPAKICGLLPQFCLLSPVPGMKNMQPPRPQSVRRVRERSSRKVSVPENRTKRTPSVELKKDKPVSTRKFSDITHEKDGKGLDGSNIYGLLQGNGQFPKQKEISLRAAFEAEGSVTTSAEKLSNTSVDDGSNPPGKRCMNFLELLASEGSEWESGSAGTASERTLYVDSVRLVKSQDSSTCSSDSKVLSNRDDLEVKDAAPLRSSCQETKHSGLSSDKMIDMEKKEFKKLVNSFPLPCDISGCRAQVETMKSHVNGRELSAEAYKDGRIDIVSQLTTKSVGKEISPVSNLSFNLPPPLPKSPSDSWLSRTLTAVSSKCPSSSQTTVSTDIVLSRSIVSKSPPAETKWETIVRTSNTHHGHLRFSEELLPPVPDA